MVGSCLAFDQEIPSSTFDKLVSLYKLVSCAKCGDLSENVYVNGECEHFVCHNCLKNVAKVKVECCAVNACEGENAKSCSKFFTSENMKPDIFLNEQAKLVLIAFDKHGISLRDVIDSVRRGEPKGLERFQLDTQTPEAKVNKDSEILSEDEQPLLQKLGSPVAKLHIASSKGDTELISKDDSLSLPSNEDVETRLCIDTDEDLKLPNQNEKDVTLPKTFSIADDSDSESSDGKTNLERATNKTGKDVFDITLSQTGSPPKDNKSKYVKNKHLVSAHKFFNGNNSVKKKTKVSPFKKPNKVPKCKPKLANDLAIPKASGNRHSRSLNPEKGGGATSKFKAATTTPTITSFEVTSASSSGEDSVYANVMRTARKALDSVENRVSSTGDTISTNDRKSNGGVSLQAKSADVNNGSEPDVNSTGDEYRTPDKTIDATIRRLSKKNAQGETELHIESRKGHLERVRQLLEEGADPNTKDNINLRPLHEHKSLQNVEVCKLLLEYGADPKVHGGERNDTPLHVAVQNDFIDVIPSLIQYGADIHAKAKTEDGRVYTPLSVAKIFDKKQIVELLESETAKREKQTSITNQPPETPLRTPKLNLSEVLQLVESPKKSAISHFTTTSLNNIDKASCSEFGRKFKLKSMPTYNASCTALLLARKIDTKQYPRTAKLMLAILKNGIVIDIDWVTQSLRADTLLPYRPYLVNGFSGYSDSVKRARDACNENMKLFTGLKAYLKPGISDDGLSNAEMKNLLISGGAKVLAREPKPESLHEVIDNESPIFIDENSPIVDLRVIIINSISAFSNGKHFVRFSPGLYHVSFHWLVNSICAFSMEAASS